MKFRKFLESHTRGHELKHVYHWDTESNWRKVLQKQGIAVWVSPNKDWNDHWASWIVSGEEHPEGKRTFYLHTLGMPRQLYHEYMNKEKTDNAYGMMGGGHHVREFVIVPKHWDQLVPIRVQKFSRNDLLKKSFRHSRRREKHTNKPTGVYSNHPGSTGRPHGRKEIERWRKDLGWKGYNPEFED